MLLLVKRYGSRFVLYVTAHGQRLETVTASSQQMILDYLDAKWPNGTRVRMDVLPPAPRPWSLAQLKRRFTHA